MQQRVPVRKRWLYAGVCVAAALLWWGRALVWLAAKQLFLGGLIALAALPVMKLLEKRLSPGAAAGLAIGAVNAAAAAALFGFVPLVIEQGRQLIAMLPGLWQNVENISQNVQGWFAQHGFSAFHTDAQKTLLERGQQALGAVVPAVVSGLGSLAGSLGQWLLAPVFGFYFLRDRRLLSGRLKRLLPEKLCEPAAYALGEIRKETAGYLRGQLMISAAVGSLTAVGLWLCGVPNWLALGFLMGILELIPYVGPIIGGVIVALFALPLGLWRTAWALGVVVAVQQLEGGVLAPKLISQTTRLHPAAVVLMIMLGGAAAGVTGILLCVPLVLCLRAVARAVWRYAPAMK